MHSQAILVALFSVATAVALVARRLKVPYTVALVVAGLVLGTAQVFDPPHLTKELLYAVFLPGLIFEAAFALNLDKLRQHKWAVVSLAIPGLVVAITVTAAILVPVVNGLHFVSDFTLGLGFVFAALIAATDPIAVVALFKSLGVPKRLAVLLEGESLFNDGTAVVVFTLVLAVVAGRPLSAPAAVLEFVRVVGMGVIIGGVVGFAISMVIHRVDDPMIEITLTTIAAYGSFVAAEQLHFSGVIATVTAGLLCGNYTARTGMSASTRVAVATFWDYLAFALNSMVFLLIGFEVRLGALVAAWKPIVVAYLAVTLGRAAVTALVALALRRTRERIPWPWVGVVTWGGLRGGLSMVLVLGLPAELPHRSLLVAMTFGVVMVSILLQGLTMKPLLKRLGLAASHEGRAEADRLRGAMRAGRAGLAEIRRMADEGAISSELASELRHAYEQRIAVAEQALGGLRERTHALRWEERATALRRALMAEKDALVTAHRSGEIAPGIYERLSADVDARLFELEDAAGHAADPS
jgi:monovalent cation:H+ antiporter, CPA1 family